MKKLKQTRKLTLNAEAVAHLSHRQLHGVAAGADTATDTHMPRVTGLSHCVVCSTSATG
jgi:hypothetical protein